MKRRILTIVGIVGVFLIGLTAGLAANGTSANSPNPQPTITRTIAASNPAPAPSVTVTETVTQTVTPTANAQGQATQISASGVYVVGKDMASGTWHTSGSPSGNSCYFATLNSTNTSDIADNNNFTGPETVNVSGVRAFDIDGDCVWSRE